MRKPTAALLATGLVLSVGALVVSAKPAAPAKAAPAAPAAASEIKPGDFKIDGAHSSVVFRISHLGIAPFYGRFNKLDGSFSFDKASPSSAVFSATIPTDSVDTGNERRDNHLKSPDFFNVKQHPVMTFKSTEVTPTETGIDMQGDLTLMGVTKPVTVKLTHTGEGDRGERFGYRSGFEGTFTIKRSDFGMNYMQGPTGLGDEVDITVAFEGLRQ